LRDSIYLTLELFLREQVLNSYARVMDIEPESFAGYDRWQ